MTGQASGGQKLTPNPNVTATAGQGGNKWGANGGGIGPIGGGVAGQTGWDERVAPAQSRAQTAENYQLSPIPVSNKGAPMLTALTQQGTAALAGTSVDGNLAAGGSNQG